MFYNIGELVNFEIDDAKNSYTENLKRRPGTLKAFLADIEWTLETIRRPRDCLEVSLKQTPRDWPEGPLEQTPIDCPEGSLQQTPIDCPEGSLQQTPIDCPEGSLQQTPIDCPEGSLQQTPIDCPEGSLQQTPIDCPEVSLQQTPIDCPEGSLQQTAIDWPEGSLQQTPIDCPESSLQQTPIDCPEGSLQQTPIDCPKVFSEQSSTEMLSECSFDFESSDEEWKSKSDDYIDESDQEDLSDIFPLLSKTADVQNDVLNWDTYKRTMASNDVSDIDDIQKGECSFDFESSDEEWKPKSDDCIDESDEDFSDIRPFLSKDTLEKDSDLDIHGEMKMLAKMEGASKVKIVAEGDACVSETVSVAPVVKHGTKRVYDKRHACLFCGDTFSKISSHLQIKHSGEKLVAEILAKKKGGKDRKFLWKKLRNMGDFHYNIKRITENKGHLIVERRPTTEKDSNEFLPCPHCLGFFVRSELWRHAKECPFRCQNNEEEKPLVYSAQILLYSNLHENSDLQENIQEILTGMKSDDVLKAIQSDNSLMSFGSAMLKRVGRGRLPNVRQKLRQLGRLLVSLRCLSTEAAVFTDFIKPKEFDRVVDAVKKISSNPSELTERGCQKYSLPSLALKLGHSLKRLAEVIRGRAIRDGDDERRKDAENFILLHDTEWADKISSHARQTIAERKYNEPDILPLTCDIVKLKDFLLQEIVRLSELLLKDINAVNWRNLAMAVLSRITIFNKRRGGETSQMKLSAYLNRKTGEWKDAENLEIISTLSPIEKKLMDRLQLVEIVGKKNRKVPVLLTKDMRNALDLLNSKRNAIGVPLENPFLFAAPSSKSGHLKCWDSLKWITNRVDLKNPDLITTTNMRKYIATVSQIVDLDSMNELEWLANHMGHTLSVHRKYYRLQEQTLELAKVSKLLIAADCGMIHKYAGKTLDDITLAEIELDKSEGEDCDEQDCSSSQEHKERTTPKIKDSKQKQKEQNQSEKDVEYVCSNAKKCTRRPWKEEDKQALRTSFHQSFTLGCPPSKSDVMLQGRKSERVRKLIEERGWNAVKYYVWNLVQQHKKRGQKMTNAKEQKN